MVCFFTLLGVSLDAQIFLTLIKTNLTVFSFVAYIFGVISKKSLPKSNVLKLLLHCFLKRFVEF